MKIKAISLSLIILISLVFPGVSRAAGISEQAVAYRVQGYQAQKNGNIDQAINYYQKAVTLNPDYAPLYNDLGVVYEKKGWLDRAEQAYFRALQIDSGYLNAYSNLALFYENRNKIDKAVFYWKKRIEFGDPNDLWTLKAWQKIAKYAPQEMEKLEAKQRELEEEILAEKIAREKEKNRKQIQKHYRQVNSLFEKGLYDKALKKADEALKLSPDDQGIINLTEKIKAKKKELEIKILAEKIAREKEKNRKQAQRHYQQASSLVKKGKYEQALKETNAALELAPDDQEMLNLAEKIRIKINAGSITTHYTQGMKYYHSGDYLNAGEEFKKMLNFLPGED